MVFNILSNFGMNLIQKGGAKAVMGQGTGINMLALFIVAILAIMMRAFIVQISYNAVAPKLVDNLGVDSTNFRPITFMESVLLVILAQNLLN